ncbi:MAG TPA: IPT/TIG domain-containing protein [Solirubrobacteraceae bacterium]|nr:IPT/TIG domain-containing protein [Solirubrobacteraceae bacterium]
MNGSIRMQGHGVVCAGRVDSVVGGLRFAGSVLWASFAVLALSVVVAAPVASATSGHAFLDNFATAGAGLPGGFTYLGPGGLAVRESNGDVYISDPSNLDAVSSGAAPRVERFDGAGVFQDEFALDAGTYSAPGAIAIGPSGGSDVVYVGAVETAAATGAVLEYSAGGVAGTPLSATGTGSTFASPVAVAADPVDGTVYVSALDTASALPVIDEFSSTGVFQVKFDGSTGAPGGAALTGVTSLAVDGAHHLFVSDGHRVFRYSAAGAYQLTVDDLTASGIDATEVAADSSTNEVYVLEGGVRVALFTAGGAREDVFATALFSTTTGMGVRSSTGMVYATDTNNVAGARYAAFAGPTVTTGSGATIDASSETLSGTIDPEGISGTTYHFDYGLDANYGASTTDADPGSGSSPVAVSGTATGLLANTPYHFHLVGVNASGTIVGADQTFTTAPAAPVVDGSPSFASAITPTGATLNGTVDAQGSDTSFHFDYGTDTTYGLLTSPDGGPLSGQGAQGASSTVTGLQPDTTYHFRVVADNGTGGPQLGGDQTFTTAPAAAAGATSVTAVRALLTGVVNPRGNPATYHFEYTRPGTPSPVTAATAETDAGSADADSPVTGSSGLLLAGTTYTVHVVVTDASTGVTTTGVDGTFTTDPAPLAVTGAVTGVTSSTATFAGSYDTHGHSGSYRFVVGSSTSAYLGESDPVTASGAGTAAGALSGLPPAQTYEVRLAVTSDGATTLGDAVTFSTPPLAPAPPPPPSGATTSPYGCVAPALAAYDGHPRPGERIMITGSDLGVGGTVQLGGDTLTAVSWSATAFTIDVPEDASGTLALTVNCGTVSNTVAVAVPRAPSNAFTATRRVKGTSVVVSVKVPGPGAITLTSAQTKPVTKHAGARRLTASGCR